MYLSLMSYGEQPGLTPDVPKRCRDNTKAIRDVEAAFLSVCRDRVPAQHKYFSSQACLVCSLTNLGKQCQNNKLKYLFVIQLTLWHE